MNFFVEKKELKNRLPIFLIGFFFVLFGVFVFFTETFTAHNKFAPNHEVIYNGKESVRWVVFLMSIGISLFGGIFKNLKVNTIWMIIFLVLGIMYPLCF